MKLLHVAEVQGRAATPIARPAQAVLQSAQLQARDIGKIVAKAVAAMREIKTFSGHISTVIAVIGDIACQTDLLPLPPASRWRARVTAAGSAPCVAPGPCGFRAAFRRRVIFGSACVQPSGPCAEFRP